MSRRIRAARHTLSSFLLGATALENFGVQVDPTTQQLKPISAVIGGFLASASRRG